MSFDARLCKLSAASHCTVRFEQVEFAEYSPNIRITTQAESALSSGGNWYFLWGYMR